MSSAIVTGAASGIGRATAVLLAERGHAVALLDHDAAGLAAVAELIGPDRAVTVTVDVADEDSVGAALDTCFDRAAAPRVLVNCAGILRLAPALETSIDDFDRVLAVNLRSIFLLSTGFARRVVAGRSSPDDAHDDVAIVNVSSVHAVVSEPNAAAYTASKGGMEALSRTLASEWAPLGIRVNCVRPGATWTALSTPLYTPEVLAALAARVPFGAPARPEQIAAAIGFLASEDSSFITGTAIDVDGGFAMHGGLPGTEYR